MADDASRIRGFVARLVRRERSLLLLRVGARALAVPALALIGLAGATLLGFDRSAAALGLVVTAGVGAWAAVALPLLREWAGTGDRLRQARAVEALAPGLRGRLVTAVEALDRGAPDGGEALLALVVGRAATAITTIPPSGVHRASPAVRAWGVTAAMAALALVALAVVGPGRLAAVWWTGAAEDAAAAAATADDAADLAKVGDLVVRYVYPDYTGLEAKVVPNGTGDVEAPPGTRIEITARSAHEVEAAGMVAYEERLEAAVEPDGRSIGGAFTVGREAGTWHFVVYRQGTPEQSRDFEIRPQDDLPPDVVLSTEEEEIAVPLDGTFELGWQARDDYGLRKVAVAVDGKESERILARPDRRKAEMSDRTGLSPRQLGLKPGDRVKLSVVAWDNDTVSGSKRGESRTVDLVVLGANGIAARLDAQREELVEIMLPILARFLTEPWPPGDTAGEVAVWGEGVSQRYQPLTDAVDRSWQGSGAGRGERALITRVLDTGRSLVRYTQVAFEPDNPAPPPDDSFSMAASLREEATVALEDAILGLVRLQHAAALGRIAQQADELVQAAKDMEAALARENPDAQELLAQLDRLERMLERMAEEAAKLDESGMKEFVNARRSEVSNLMDEVRKALAEGRTEDARKLMSRLSQLMSEMGDGIHQQMEQARSESDQSMQEAEDLQKELEALEQEQRKLQQDVQALQQQDQTAQQNAKLWEELERRAAAHRDDAGRFEEELAQAGRAFFEQERSAAGVDAAEELIRAIQTRDVRGSRAATDQGQIAWSIETRAMESERARRRGLLPGPGQADVGQLQRELQEIRELLDQMEQQSSQMSPETRARSQELEDRQRDLQNRTSQAAERTQALERQFPVRPQGLQQAMDDAKGRMQQAGDDLGQGDPLQAEGSQGMAAQRLKEARDALRQAQQQAREQAQQMEQGQQGQGQEAGDEGQDRPENGDREGDDFEHAAMEIPGREEFQTPEEYRRALLEGAEGEVPEEYRAMKRRYFEELVSQ